MALSIWQANASVMTVNQGATARSALVGNLQSVVENDCKVPVSLAGVLSSFFVRVSANSLSGACPITLRKNSADGSMAVSYGAAETGIKEDTSNTDTLASGDFVAVGIVPAAGSGSISVRVVSALFAPTDASKTYTPFHLSGGSGSAFYDSDTQFNACQAQIGSPSTPESDCQTRIKSSCTISVLTVRVGSNSRTTNTVFKTRVNAADGAQSVTFGNVETGDKSDITNSDTLADGDDLTYAITTGTGGGGQNINTRRITVACVSTNGRMPLLQRAATATSHLDVSGQVPRYYALGGIVGNPANATESLGQFTSRVAFTWKLLTVKVNANTRTNATTITSRKDSAAGNQSLSFAAAETGVKTDLSGTDTVVDGSVLDTEVNFTVVGDVSSITIAQISALGEIAAAATRRWILGRH